MSVGWIAAALVLEIASCAAYVVIFRFFFAAVPARRSRSPARLDRGGVWRAAAYRRPWSSRDRWLAVASGGDVEPADRREVQRPVFLDHRDERRRSCRRRRDAVQRCVRRARHGDPRRCPNRAGSGFDLRDARAAGRFASRAAPTLAAVAGRCLGGHRGGPSFPRGAQLRVLGAVGYLGFDIAALRALFAAAGHPMPSTRSSLAT